MTSRERVIAALDFKRPDRVPRYDIFLADFISQWEKSPYYQPGKTIYEAFPGVDIACVAADQSGPYPSLAREEDIDGASYYEYDTWGRKLYHRRDKYFFAVEGVAIGPDRRIPPFEPFDPEQCRRRLAGYRAHPWTDKCIVTGIMGLFMPSYYMRGETDLLYDLMDNEGFCRELAEQIAQRQYEVAVTAAAATDAFDTALWIYDELATNKGPLISPRTFERVYYPVYKKLLGRLKAAGIRHIVLHCDGNSTLLLDMLVDAGFNGLQSLAPTAGMWLPDIRKKYGNRLALIGGMDNIHTLATGTRAEIERQAAELLEVAREGGVILGTHSIDYDIPVENYVIYDEYMKAHGACG